jgi:1,4-dihydroxy-2-naphthoyl-CoA hydrolase
VRTLDELNAAGARLFPGLVGVEVLEARGGLVAAQLAIREEHLAPNGYLHAGCVVALADTACGYGCVLNLPDGASGFTTVELKANFVGTAKEGEIACTASLRHAGRTTQVWDAEVARGSERRTIALFRCTQLIVYDDARR